MGPLFSTVYKSSHVSLKMFQSDTWSWVLKSEMYKKRFKILLNKWSHWVNSSQADERTIYNTESDSLTFIMCLVLQLHEKRGFGKPCNALTHTHTHLIFGFHLGFVVATQRGEQLFLWFLSGSGRRLMHPESYEKLCFVGISCMILHTKAARAIQLTQLLEPADDFPNTDWFGNLCFSPTTLCYILRTSCMR